MITVKGGISYSDGECLCASCRNNKQCPAMHGIVQVCMADERFISQCSQYAKNQLKKGRCPCRES